MYLCISAVDQGVFNPATLVFGSLSISPQICAVKRYGEEESTYSITPWGSIWAITRRFSVLVIERNNGYSR